MDGARNFRCNEAYVLMMRGESGAHLPWSKELWRKRTMGKLTWFTAGVIAGLSAAAIGQELARHPKERTWKGKVAGVPYNFHVAEWGEVARGYWNPEDEKVISSRGIGLGWGVNFAAVTQKAQGLV